ncbi:hypothetical protein FBU30_005292 [Linnemannia zychae]|nr:hypothetical protein FBU30_005292 [Linnemannia zychae]
MFCAEKDANQDLSDVKFSPINLQVAILHYHKHTINIWDPLGTKLQCTLKHDGRVFNLAWSYCEQWIAVGCAKSVWLWNRMSDMSLNWTCAVVIRNFHGFIHSIDWKPNELTLVTGCNDGSVRVWKLVNLLNVWSAQLIWGAGNGVLAAADAIFSKVIGLSPIHQKLLEQRK